MQSRDGNLVVYGPSGATWASNTSGHPGAYVQLAPNGQMTIYNAPSAGGTVLWVSDNYEGPCATLKMQSDGNLVIYDSGGVARWASLIASRTSNDRLLSAPPPPSQESSGQARLPRRPTGVG